MSIPPVIIPEQQFFDSDGDPLAGGTLETYVPDTSTPKATWIDPDQTALNTNPVVLDAAGRCILYGDGEYRLILRDAVGNEIWDIQATTLVSAAMAPVIAAPTIPDAVHALGIDELIDAEALARSNADSAEQTARIAADNAEIAARTAADTTLQANIDAERARALAAEAHLQTEIDALAPGGGGSVAIVQGGMATTSITPLMGHVHITFPTAFPTACTAVVCTCANASFPVGFIGAAAVTFTVSSLSPAGADVFAYGAGSPSGPVDVALDFYWVAVGT